MSLAPQSESPASAARLGAALREVCRAQAEARERTRWLEGKLGAHALGSSEFLLLWLVGCEATEGAPQHALAEQVGLSPPQASVLLEKLRCGGWLVSVRPAHDRRKQFWQLTAEGRENLEALVAEMAAREEPHGEYSVGLLEKEAAA